MIQEYRWTRWAAPGGAGHGLIGWLAIAFGFGLALMAFYSIKHWWWALPAAVLAWFAGTGLVGGLWACVRFVIEKYEGIG